MIVVVDFNPIPWVDLSAAGKPPSNAAQDSAGYPMCAWGVSNISIQESGHPVPNYLLGTYIAVLP